MFARVAALLFLLLALPVQAEIYRWTDGEGREHFTMDLHSVPPEHRAAAERRAVLDQARESEPSKLNSVSPPQDVQVKRALRPRRSRVSRTPASAAPVRCSSTHKSQGQSLTRDVERWERKLALEEDMARRLVRTEDRLRAENRVERYAVHLEHAQQAREDFEDRMRQKGVPPGCYR